MICLHNKFHMPSSHSLVTAITERFHEVAILLFYILQKTKQNNNNIDLTF
jgi:hypothetical protein